MKYIKLLIITLFIIFTSSHAQEIYKWVDENGKVHFGDRKPDTQDKVEALNIKLINSVETVTYQPSSIDVGKKVVIYTTSWCGYCKKAKMEFDKLGGKGVPVILVGKKRMSGFSEAGFERIYAP